MVDLMSFVIKAGATQNEILQLLRTIWDRAIDIIKQPVSNPDMVWVLLPLIVAVILIQLYFGRYQSEKLGWNSALANSLVLFFVGMNLLQWLFRNDMFILITADKAFLAKNIMAIGITSFSLILMVLNFFHILPKRVAFNISSGVIINYLAAISVIIIYSNISIDALTLTSTLFIFALFCLVTKILQLLETPAPPEEEVGEIEEEIQEKVKDLKEIKQKRNMELKEEIKKIKKEKNEINGKAKSAINSKKILKNNAPKKSISKKKKSLKKVKGKKGLTEEELFKKLDKIDNAPNYS